jgi:secreted PhoX family phosphatase
MPALKPGASNTTAEQALQWAYTTTASTSIRSGSSGHGLLCTNHEYTDDGVLHAGGLTPWTAEKVRKAQAARISVTEWV